MITIQSVMLIVLGFLLASLLVLLLAPAYWRRAVRLTTTRIKRAMPLTEAEIKADKDRLRAEYAIKVHHLEAKVEQSALSAARQQIELNRRDAAVSALEGEIGRLKASLEEHENARRVLEQTITDRFPRLEQRLTEARRQLSERDRDLAAATETATRNKKALDEASQLGTQQRDEVMRLNSALTTLSARTREGMSDPKFDAEVALRTELEVLRGKTQQQAAVIARLQAGASGAEAQAATGDGIAASKSAAPAVTEQVLAAAFSDAEAAKRDELEKELHSLRATLEDRTVEIEKLKAALAAYERGSGEERTLSLKDSRLAMKVRLGALQAENDQQAAAIQRMRGEIAAANEKLARQAAHFMSEMRRIGTGSLPAGVKATLDARREAPDPSAPIPLAARRLAEDAHSAAGRQALSPEQTPADAGGSGRHAPRAKGLLQALGKAARGKAEPRKAAAETGASVTAAIAAGVAEEGAGDATSGADGDSTAPRRLVERIAGATKS